MSDEFDTPSAPAGQRPAGRRKPKNGEVGIRYGSRNFIVTPCQRLVANNGPWHLVAVPSRCKGQWYNFKLYYDRAGPKNLFHLAVSNGAVAMKREVNLLDEHHPGIKEWALQQAMRWINGEVELRPERGKRITYYTKRGWIRTPVRRSK